MPIEYSKSAAKSLQRMEKKLRTSIHEAIMGLTQSPPRGDIRPMQGHPAGRYRLRVGSYRVIYRYDCRGAVIVLCIIDIGTRGDIYK